MDLLDRHIDTRMTCSRILGQAPPQWPAYGEAQAKGAIGIFQELEDEHGLARAWQLMAETFWVRCQVAASEAAQLQAIEHARRAGDHREEATN